MNTKYVPLLAQYLLSSFASELGRGSMHFSSHEMDCLVNCGWPGNVRELENEVKRAATLADSDVIDESYLSEHVRGIVGAGLKPALTEGENQPLKVAVEEYEIRLIKEALEKNRRNKQKASRIL